MMPSIDVRNTPKGWIEVTLGEIVEPSRVHVAPIEVPDLPYVSLGHIEPQTMKLIGCGEAREIRSSSLKFSTGDVLYGKMRPYLNKVWPAEFDGICSPEFFVFPKSSEINNQFFAFRLNAKDFVDFANHQVSGDRPRVDFTKLARFSFLLPPFDEQVRIAQKLENVLSALQRAESAARRAQERLQRYRAAIVRDALAGKLTRSWRENQAQGGTESETGQRILQLVSSKRNSENGQPGLDLGLANQRHQFLRTFRSCPIVGLGPPWK